MSEFSVAEARDQLPALIDRALSGESVVITRHGQPIVELRILEGASPPDRHGLKWLDANRVPTSCRADTASELSRMRDEDWT